MFNPGDPADIDLFKARFSFEQENMKAFYEMLPVLRARYPDRKIIVRPHPAENHQRWRDLVSRIDGVEVHGDGPVIPWILASDLLIHNACTTGIEALLLDHPAIAYCSYSNAFESVFLANQVSTRSTTLDDLARTADEAFRDPVGIAARQKLNFSNTLEAHYFDASNSLATERVFGEIERLSNSLAQGELLRPGGAFDPNEPYPVQQKTRVSLTRDQLMAQFEHVTGKVRADQDMVVEKLGESLFSMRSSPR
jgi:hypothetical protein